MIKFVSAVATPAPRRRKLVEIANGVEAVQDARIYIERVNAPFPAAGGSAQLLSVGYDGTRADLPAI